MTLLLTDIFFKYSSIFLTMLRSGRLCKNSQSALNLLQRRDMNKTIHPLILKNSCCVLEDMLMNLLIREKSYNFQKVRTNYSSHF